MLDPYLASFAPLFAQQGGNTSFFIMVAMLGVLFYLVVLRPERSKQQEQAKMLESLKKNDRVVTIGGIIGVVVNTNAGSEEVTLRIDESDGTRLTILRSAISRVVVKDKDKDAEQDQDS